MTRTERAAAARQRADKLSYDAETIGDREPCRDVAGDRNRLREAAGRADQRATVAEVAARYGRARGRP
jgi:hypothetical protein